MSFSPSNIDSIIFDMDGTLWNATGSYAKIWNATCQEFGMHSDFKGEDLVQFMGMSIESIMEHLLGDNMTVDKNTFLKALGVQEDAMMPMLGGVLFSGVRESLKDLHGQFRLFMLSNCSAKGLINFVNFTGTSHLFEGLLTQGERPVEKSENLRYMASKYSLHNPTYVGDTQGDCDQCHAANMPFTYAAWGFGSCINAEWQFSSIQEMTNHFLMSKTLQ